ncbi:S8 family serine peptidase [Micromonosporaceae bacterium DT55]|uniref:S8 family serine peptidase n=1 Tax=Melissospora conviva TaxID=3388432 RepID=UPI003C17383C
MQVGPPQFPPPPPPSWDSAGPPPAPAPSPWAVVAAVLTGGWAVGVTVLCQSAGWLVEQVLLLLGLTAVAWQWPVVAVLNAVLVLVPVLLLATLPRSAAIRAAGRAWLAAVVALALLGALRAVPIGAHELYLLLTALVAGLLAVALRLRNRRRRVGAPAPDTATVTPTGRSATDTDAEATTDQPTTDTTTDQPATGTGAGVVDERPARRTSWPAAVPAFAVGVLMLLPWLWVGALGGVAETVCALAAAVAVGLLAGAVLDGPFWAAYRVEGGARPVRTVLAGGLVAGVALLLIGAGTGHSGTQLALLVTLPAAAFALAAVQQFALNAGRPGAPAAVAWLVAPVVFGPLAFADPEEISLLLAMGRDVPYWVAVATVVSLAAGLVLGLGYGALALTRRGRVVRRPVAAATVAVLVLAAAAVYTGPGRPGFYGERLFVVLTEQADLGAVRGEPGQAGRDARAREVYRRLVETAERSQAPLRDELDRLGVSYTPYYLVNAIEVDAGPAVRAWLARRPEVSRVLVSQRLRPLPAAPAQAGGDAPAPTGVAWNIRLLRADDVWSELGVDGAGIVVGTSDSGVDGTHPALAASFRGGDDSWYDPWNATPAPADVGGHGTHTLGSAVGAEGIGVAPGSRWVGCVNLDRNLGNPARYLDCLQYMLAPFPAGGDAFTDGRPERAPHVLTNSWGCPPIEGCDPASLRPAATALTAAGIFVVAAAGNTGPRCGSIEDPPAPYADVFTVGAVDRSATATDFSSRGPAPGGVGKPDVVAPGADVVSAMPGGGFSALDGTSMATPQVAGVVALMWSAYPQLIGDVATTSRILRETTGPARAGADDCGDPRNVVGSGLVDAYAAVVAAQSTLS